MIVVALDAMGGDNAPAEIVKGAVDAVLESDQVTVKLVGREDAVRAALQALESDPVRGKYDRDRVLLVPAQEVIETAEPPVNAIRAKKDSSIVRALRLVKEQEADAFVSSGSTGAVLVGGQLIVGKIKGVQRTPLAPLIPTIKGVSLLVDCGANVDARPSHLLQFARMGSIYMKYAMGIADPRVGILNIGAEEEKGNALVKETFPMLKACEDIHFIGSVEARDLIEGNADVIVCDAFAGNIALKMYEGVGSALIGEIKHAMYASLRGKIGGALAKPSLKAVLKKFDATEYGGAPMLGLKGLVVKSHGNAKAREIRNAVLQCIQFTRQDISGKIAQTFLADKEETNRE